MTSMALPARAQGARRSTPVPVRGAAVAVTLSSALGRRPASVGTAATTDSSWSFDPTAELVAAALVGASLAWLAPRMTGTLVRRATTLGVLLFASVAAVMIAFQKVPLGIAMARLFAAGPIPRPPTAPRGLREGGWL